MAVLKNKDIKIMNTSDLNKRLKELNLELIKSRSQRAQGAAVKTKEIKKAVARIFTQLNKQKK